MSANLKNEDYKELTITDLCDMLSISKATAKNWIKLNKITPSYIINNTIYFSKDYVNTLIANLQSDSTNLLKSRRNKKFNSGSFFYKDYISSSSKNIDIISSILEYVEFKKLSFTPSEILYIIADCSIQLLIQKYQLNSKISHNYLCGYLNGAFSLDTHNQLIDDLIDNKNNAIEFIKKYPNFFNTQYFYEQNEDILGLLYISLLNISQRKAQGSYYTPTKIVKKIISHLNLSNINNKNILDPACGTGNFLLQLPKNICIENIYGNDKDEIAIKIARLNILLNFNISNIEILYKNFTNKDFLLEDFEKKFDYILGNPPWGAEFSNKDREKLRKKYITAKNKNIDSYDVFIEKALNILNIGGYLSFVLPEAILSVKNHKTIRSYIMKNNSIIILEMLGNIFNKVHCPSIILELKHTNSPLSCLNMKVITKNRDFVISKERLAIPEVFNFNLSDEEYSIYQKIMGSQNKIYLKDNATFALGLVTGNNKKYLSNIKTDKNERIIKGSDIKKYKIKDSASYIEYQPDRFQQVAPTKYYRASEKLFYKFISNKLTFAYDNSQYLSLNSCNILIPKFKNYDIKYILAILNSRISQFIFEKRYNSVKVLRSHIESIPIPTCNQEEQNEIINLVNTILNNKTCFENLYEKLEETICNLYGLNKIEYEIIKKATD